MFTSAEQYRKSVEEGKAFCVVIGIGLRSVFAGLDLGSAIASSRRPIPIIFIGPADAAIQEQALVIGCAAYLEEPVASDMLISAIRGLSPRDAPPPPRRKTKR